MIQRLWILACGFAVIATATGVESEAGDLQKLLATNGLSEDIFGQAVAVDGDTAIVGASGRDEQGEDSGTVYVFVRDSTGTWVEHQQLLPPGVNRPRWSRFGSVVALDGDTALIGAPQKHSGLVYVYTRGADGIWRLQQWLTAADEWGDAKLGFSLSIDGDTAALGAPYGTQPVWPPGPATGSVYIFTRNPAGTWQFKQELFAHDAAEWDVFGAYVSVSGDTLAVGATSDNSYSGSVYTFQRQADGTWVEEQKLVASKPTRFFGRVALDGNRLLVGAPGFSEGFVYTRDEQGTWIERQRLDGFGTGSAGFGNAVAMKDEIMLIGTSSASAYVFARNGRDLWYERRMLVGAGSDQFGGSVFTDGETIAIGAPFDNSIGFHTGAAYVSRLPLIVQIDAPEDSGNRVNPFSRGVIPVAILGGDSFDVADVDVTTLAFGPAGAPPAHNLTDSFTYNDHLQDVNLDGYMDLVTHFRTRDTGIACGDSSATLTGELLDGQPFEGTDSIQTVGCRETRRPAIWMKDEEKAGEPRGGIVNLERK